MSIHTDCVNLQQHICGDAKLYFDNPLAVQLKHGGEYFTILATCVSNNGEFYFMDDYSEDRGYIEDWTKIDGGETIEEKIVLLAIYQKLLSIHHALCKEPECAHV